MKKTVDIKIENFRVAQKTIEFLTLGHYFAYLREGFPRSKAKGSSRLTRLRIKDEEAGSQVFPLVEEKIELPGMTLTPRDRGIEPLGCLVTDRDLYRAEQDTVYLFAAVPSPSKNLKVVVECNGVAFTERSLELADGVGMETLSMLLPGSYSAQLAVDGKKIGTPTTFTVAEYTLAPLSGRLLSHELDRTKEKLAFELGVESYQVPFDGRLEVTLTEGGRPISSVTLSPKTPGRYRGSLEIRGEGPFSLQLVDADDAERSAEVAIPGSRAAEREVTVFSELGKELLFSMMPEAGALPLRGGYLSEGDVLATPLTVDEIVTDRWAIQIRKDVESLHLVTIDLATGRLTATEHGDAKAGEEVIVEAKGSMCTVVAGCFVGGKPFEGYTTFIQPARLELDMDTPQSVRPGDDLVVRLSLKGLEKEVPVLLSIRDERLTSLDRPAIGLGASTKKNVADATVGMDEGFKGPEDFWRFFPPVTAAGASGSFVRRRLSTPLRSVGAPEEIMYELSEPMAAGVIDEGNGPETAVLEPVMYGEAVPLKGGAELSAPEIVTPAEEPARGEFPQVLFYGIVPVAGGHELTLPAGDSLATYSVEAFALSGGDWCEARKTLTVDKPVRIDMELPPAVHPEDKVLGRLRAVTESGKASITLTRDEEAVSLPGCDGVVIDTPKQIEFPVKPGTYLARVEDVSTGEVDSVEFYVGTPGRFKSYAKELGLLQAGDTLTLDSADALTIRILPAVEEPFQDLLTATADYVHLCCEQTAAKIIAAIWMYLTAKGEAERRRAEQIILAGIAREKKMILPGKGFAMYPEQKHVIEHYSRLAVRYLWSLDKLAEMPGLSKSLRDAVREGVEMADTAAEAHGMTRVPERIDSVEDAYAAAAAGGNTASAQKFLSNLLDSSSATISIRGSRPHAVSERSALAYAAASLIALDQLAMGIRIANQVTRQFNEEGRLYSTVDSVAAIVLMIQLRSSQLVTGGGRVRVNGKEMSTLEATELADQVESIEVLKGAAAVEVTRIREEDWGAYSSGFPLRVGFRDSRNKKVDRFRMGDRVELLVNMPQGYETGDLAHVCLPACMSWLQGGGKVKRFTMDFAGADEMRIPVVVTSNIQGKQHFALCVRNMFEEERATSPGVLTVNAP